MTEVQPTPLVEAGDEAGKALLQSALALCREKPYAEFSAADVAARAGLDEQELLRRWPTKALLVLQALFREVGPKLAYAETGDFAADLRAQLDGIVGAFADPAVGPHLAALAAEANRDPKLAQVFLDRVFTPNRAAARKRFGQAQEAGQVRRDIDLDAAIDMAFGPVWFRLLLGTGGLDPGLGGRLAEQLLAGIAVPSPSASDGSAA
jgi:AcrR family transcriptional regulator